MKKIAFVSIALLLIVATSCKKNAATTGNSWTFESVTYPTGLCTNSSGSLQATCTSANQTLAGASLLLTFPNHNSPAAGTYTVVNNGTTTPAAMQVSIVLVTGIANGEAQYGPTGTGTTHVNVSIAYGYVTVSGSGIMMSSGTDSAAVSMNVSQTQ